MLHKKLIKLASHLCAAISLIVISSTPTYAQSNTQNTIGANAYSDAFRRAAEQLDQTLIAAKANSAVQQASRAAATARDSAALAAAQAQVDAALDGAQFKIDAAAAVATTATDKLKLGGMLSTYGTLIVDPMMQRKGLIIMMESGLLDDTKFAQLNWFLGVISYQIRDYEASARYLQAAKNKGYMDPQLDALLTDAIRRSNDPASMSQRLEAERNYSSLVAARTKLEEAERQRRVAAAEAERMRAEAARRAEIARMAPLAVRQARCEQQFASRYNYNPITLRFMYDSPGDRVPNHGIGPIGRSTKNVTLVYAASGRSGSTMVLFCVTDYYKGSIMEITYGR